MKNLVKLAFVALVASLSLAAVSCTQKDNPVDSNDPYGFFMSGTDKAGNKIEMYEKNNKNLQFSGQKQLQFVTIVTLKGGTQYNSIENPEYFTWDAEEWRGVKNDDNGWFEFNGTADDFRICCIFAKNDVKLQSYIWVTVKE